MIKIKPAPGLKIRDPKTKQFIPADGIQMQELSTFWHRRIADGDAVVCEPKVKDSAKENSEKPKQGGA